MSDQALERARESGEMVRSLQESLSVARSVLYGRIHDAVEAGVSVEVLSEQLGLSMAHVYQIWEDVAGCRADL